MKLVYCILDYHAAGGTERTLSVQANYFAEHGAEVCIVSTETNIIGNPFYKFSDKIKFYNLNINYHRVDGKISPVSVFKRLCLGYLHRLRLTRLLKEIKPDFTFSMFGHEMKFLTRINDGSCKILEFHFFRYYKDVEIRDRSLSLYKKVFEKMKLKFKLNAIDKYDAFVVLTKEDAENWRNFKNLHVIPNALPSYSDRISECKSKRVISVGRLSKQKGFDILIDVWKLVSEKHPDWSLDIFGEGECRNFLQEKAKGNGLYNIEFHRPVCNINDKYLESSIFVLSSRYEGFGIVLIEAMACGLPCVTFNCPCGPSEIVVDGESGFVVPAGNVELMADKICTLIENYELRIAMGQNALKSVSRYDIDVVMSKWKELLQKLGKNEDINS